jgi:hypothetical protein
MPRHSGAPPRGPASGRPDDRLRGEPGIQAAEQQRVASGLRVRLRFAEPAIGRAHRVRPLAGPMAGSGATRWAPRNDSLQNLTHLPQEFQLKLD